MTPPLEWQEWLAESFYRIRVSRTAFSKIRALPDLDQDRLRLMLEEIASVADSLPPSSVGRGFSEGQERLLLLAPGRLTVHYSLDERTRTLSVEHVSAAQDSHQAGSAASQLRGGRAAEVENDDGEFGQTG